MIFRSITFVILFFCITSCDSFPFFKNNKPPVLDTIVNFSKVDIYPSFKVCDSIIDKQKKSDCFRVTIHQKIGKELLQHQLIIKEAIDEVVYVDLIIDSSGIFSLDVIESSENIKKQLPELDSLLRSSVQKLPKIYAAVKRGIPVTTKYKLPIRIQLKE